MLGRAPERAAIERLLDDAGQGRPGGLLLTGDPGIGKTTVLEHARDEGRARGWTVLTARGDAATSEHPFGALAGLLRPLEHEVDDLPPAAGRALRVGLGLERGAAAAGAVAAAALRLLGRAAARQPVVLALDDVQWFDRSTTDALGFAHRHLADDRIATVATARAGAVPSAPDWGPAVTVRPLDGLEEPQLLALAGEVDLAPDVAEQLTQLTLGNPLGFRELVALLSPEQRTGRDPLPPIADPGPVLRAAFATRLAELPARVRRALVVVAADETGLVPVIQTALGLLGERTDLEQVEAAGILVRDGDRLTFTHPLLRAAAYHGVALASRRKVHRALAAALDRPELAEHRAWQLAAAVDGPDDDVAEALTLVAQRSVARGATASGARVLEQAAELSRDPAQAADRLASAGELWLVAGDLDRARTTLDQARSTAPPASVPLAAHLWAAVVERWTSGPLAAARALRTVPTGGAALHAAIEDEDRLHDGAATSTSSRAPRRGDPGRERALIRLATVRLSADAAAVASVPELLAPLEGSPLAFDAAALRAVALERGGRLLEAYRDLTAVLAPEDGITAARSQAEVELARLEVLLGQGEAAEARLVRVEAVVRPLGVGLIDDAIRRTRGLRVLGEGAFADAAAVLAPVDRPGVAEAGAVAADHAEALTGAGRSPDRAAWHQQLAAIVAVDGSLAAGLVARAAALVDGSRAALDAAAERLVPFPFEHARTLLLLAERHGPSADDALEAFERLGAAPWATRARGPAAPPAPVATAEAAALATLSAAELRVAVAVGAGRSNREAAEELFLSIKTIDHHLQHIYRKLGLRGRAELAVLVTRGTP